MLEYMQAAPSLRLPAWWPQGLNRPVSGILSAPVLCQVPSKGQASNASQILNRSHCMQDACRAATLDPELATLIHSQAALEGAMLESEGTGQDEELVICTEADCSALDDGAAGMDMLRLWTLVALLLTFAYVW